MIKVLVIDDERLARQEILRLLAKCDGVEVIGEAANADDAIEKINSMNPDLILLDINMPEKNGFDLLAELEDSPQVIFVTAYDQFAIKAFEVNALDYVMKPVRLDRLQSAIEKVKEDVNIRKQETQQLQSAFDVNKQIFIKDGNKCYFLKMIDVYLIESIGNYAQLHTSAEKPLLHKSLNQLEEKLPEHIFFRANRQQMINLNYIKNIESYFKGELQVTLLSGDKVEVSMRQSVRFKELLSL